MTEKIKNVPITSTTHRKLKQYAEDNQKKISALANKIISDWLCEFAKNV